MKYFRLFWRILSIAADLFEWDRSERTTTATENMYFIRWKREWTIFEKFINFESIRKFVFVRLAQVQATVFHVQSGKLSDKDSLNEWVRQLRSTRNTSESKKKTMFNIHWTICVYILLLDVMPYQTHIHSRKKKVLKDSTRFFQFRAFGRLLAHIQCYPCQHQLRRHTIYIVICV